MKVSTQPLEGSQVELVVEAEPQEMAEALEQAYRQLAGRASVPGFRKGKAPRAILERYLGHEALQERALNWLVPELYRRALEDKAIEAIADPDVEVTETDPLAFKATVAVWPAVELGEYHLLRLDPELVVVTEEEVEAALEELRRQATPWEPVERPTAFGDLLTLDVRGRRDGREVLRQEDASYHLVESYPWPVPGFAERLVGVEAGKEVDFSISFPPDHASAALAGKEFSFTVRVREVKAQRLPPLDDDFAKGVVDGFDTLEALRQHLAQGLRQRAEAPARARLAEKALEQAVAQGHFQLPEVLVEREAGRLLQLRRQEGGLEAQLEAVGRPEVEVREEARLQARERLGRSLVLDAIAREEGIEVTPQEVEAEAKRLAQGAGEARAQVEKSLDSEEARASLRRSLLARKTLDRLAGIALGEVASARTARTGLWVPGSSPETPPEKGPPLERQTSGLWLPQGPASKKKR